MRNDSYRPWIAESRRAHPTDLEVLRRISEGKKTPFGIAKGYERISVVRTQCHFLEYLGLINQTAIDSYAITKNGKEKMGSTDMDYIPVEENLELEYDHVVDLGKLLNSETIIQINSRFFEAEGAVYGDSSTEKQDIESIRDARLERLTMEFPRFEPLTNQLAHIVRTFCGYHPFPDANHRTGTHIADILANKQGYDLFSLLQEDDDGIKRAVETSKILRGLCSNVRNSVNYLWVKDELFFHWNRYFRDLLYDVEPQKRVHTVTGECQYDNLCGNEEVTEIYEFATKGGLNRSDNED